MKVKYLTGGTSVEVTIRSMVSILNSKGNVIITCHRCNGSSFSINHDDLIKVIQGVVKDE
ncbi:MAG: hypothetical protein RSB70_03650 [Clostridium sp.]